VFKDADFKSCSCDLKFFIPEKVKKKIKAALIISKVTLAEVKNI
jgi:hypothetical protein